MSDTNKDSVRFRNPSQGKITFYTKDRNKITKILDGLIGVFGRNRSEVLNHIIESQNETTETA